MLFGLDCDVSCYYVQSVAHSCASAGGNQGTRIFTVTLVLTSAHSAMLVQGS